MESADDSRRRPRRFTLEINNEPSHLFSARPLCVTHRGHLFRSSTLFFKGAFTFGTVIFSVLVRMSTVYTTIVEVMKVIIEVTFRSLF